MKKEYENHTCSNTVNCAVIIPALNPMPNLVGFVKEILKYGMAQVIVVNDGSNSSFNDIFDKLKRVKNCTVLLHKQNQGKGSALKTAFAYVLENYPHLDGVITADADGQHLAEDIYKVCKKLMLSKGSIVLGERDFNKMPKRSLLGNTISSRVFEFFYNNRIKDTQTGLRGIPISELNWMIGIKGERYEYEINMLIKAKNHNLSFSTIPINTVYFDNNKGTHFSTIRDSARIFICLISGILRYSGLTIIAGLIDVSVFFLLNSVILSAFSSPLRILLSTVIARITSSICNYLMNRNIMFPNSNKPENSVFRYYVLFVFLIAASFISVYTISLFWRINESVIKLIVDILLGFFSYQVQLRWVFSNKKDLTLNV